MSEEEAERDLSRFFVETLLLLSGAVLLSDVIQYFETGIWANILIMEFVDVLTGDGEGASAGLTFGFRYVLSVVPVIPVFLAGCIALLWNATKSAR